MPSLSLQKGMCLSMSELHYQERISTDLAPQLIGEENIKEGAKYYLITDASSTTVLCLEEDGTETEYKLKEPEFTGYSEEVNYAKFDPVVAPPPKRTALYLMYTLLGLALAGGIFLIVLLTIYF